MRGYYPGESITDGLIRRARVPLPVEGDRFDRLTFTGAFGHHHEHRKERPKNPNQYKLTCECVCECGRTEFYLLKLLKAGTTRSCGCLQREKVAEIARRPRLVIPEGKPEYRQIRKAWTSMIDRCLNPKSEVYPNYGGRGITVCPRWVEDFQEFRQWALANGFARRLTLDRIDNESGYSPENCRWTTHLVQNRNRRDNIRLTAWGETKCLSEWMKDPRCTGTRNTVTAGLKRGLSHELAMTTRQRKAPQSRSKRLRQLTFDETLI